MPQKTCAGCKRTFGLDGFSPSPGARLGRYNYCRECQRAKQREWYTRHREKARELSRWRTTKWRFGITEESFNEKLLKQGGVCAICGEKCAAGGRLTIDHDHGTGELRDLLCRNCNAGLGQFNDDPELLRAAMEYLLRWRSTRGALSRVKD